MPEPDGQYILDTDASDVGLGAVLSQVQNDEERVIAYASRTLQKPERNYETTKKELLALVYGLKQFRQYLLGRPIIIRVDHAALGWLKRTAEPLPQLARWLTFIEGFDYKIVHRPGRKHVNADTMSRRPEPTADDEKQNLEEPTGTVLAVRMLDTIFEESEPEEPSPIPRLPPLHQSTTGLAGSQAVSGAVEADPDGAAGTVSPPSTPQSARPSPRKRRSRTKPLSPQEQLEGLEAAQMEDEEIGPLQRLMRQSTEKPPIDELLPCPENTKKFWSQWYRMQLNDGILYRMFEVGRSRPPIYQAFVPYSLREAAIRQCHTGMAGGHLGAKKTLDQVQRRFYWPTWRSDTVRHCRRCPECCAYHRGKLPQTAPLQPIVAGAPFERLSIDLTGPHTRSRRGHIYILTCIDPFTKWAEAFPIRNKEAETVAKVLVEQVFCRFGVPIALLSDQGKEVDGNLMREICRLLDIDKLRTSPYKASTNAAIERFHRSLNGMLGKVIKESQTDWDERLPFVMAAYRASRHDSTGFSPNALTLGRETKAPVDLVLNPPSAEEPLVHYDDYVERLRDRIRGAYTLVREELGRAAERNRKYYDLRVRPRQYSIGQWVYYYNPRHYRGRQDKWSRKYGGPFLVTALPSAVNVTLQKSRNAKPFTVHIDKVKPFLSEPPQSWLTVPDPATAVDVTTPTEAAPTTPTARPPKPPKPSEPESPEPSESESPEPPEAGLSTSPSEVAEPEASDLDDTIFYDADLPFDSDVTLPKYCDSGSVELSERLEAEHYAADEAPAPPRRSTREHRLPPRYRD